MEPSAKGNDAVGSHARHGRCRGFRDLARSVHHRPGVDAGCKIAKLPPDPDTVFLLLSRRQHHGAFVPEPLNLVCQL